MKQALAQLFGPEASFIFHYPPGVSGQLVVPRDVWVLGTVREGAAESPRQAKLDSHDRVLPGPEEPESLSKRSEAEGGLTDPALYDSEVIAQLTVMAQDKNPGTRLQALSALAQSGKANETELQTAIDAALSDKDPSVRSAAYQALASHGGPEAMGCSGKRWRTQTQACGSWLWTAWLLGRRAKRCSRRRFRTQMRPFASWLRSD